MGSGVMWHREAEGNWAANAKCLSTEILQCCVKWSTPQTLFPCQNPKITQCKNFSFVRTEPLSLVLITLADRVFF